MDFLNINQFKEIEFTLDNFRNAFDLYQKPIITLLEFQNSMNLLRFNVKPEIIN